MDWSLWYRAALALVLWREARGEGRDGMRAVAHVIRNRVNASHIPDSWDTVIEKPWQFSSMTATGDAELVLWPRKPDPAFETAMQIATSVYAGGDFDLTSGATHYFNPNVVLPEWAAGMTRVASIGHHDFYR